MISIITPTYNRIESLKVCVQSIINEYTDGMELIIIDDCSTDGTQEWLKSISSQHEFIKIIYCSKNAGVNVARNKGIHLSSQPYIMFIDSDDKLINGSILKLVNFIGQHPKNLHFLAWLSYRKNDFLDDQDIELVHYSDWVRGNVNGDYTHIVSAEILKKNLFFEQFRMFEQLNWFRIFKSTSPQILLPLAVADIDLGSPDSLTKQVKKKKLSSLKASFNAEFLFIQMYSEDMIQFNERLFNSKLLKTMVMGIVCKMDKETTILKSFALKPFTRFGSCIIFLIPAFLVRFFFLRLKKIEIDECF